MQRVSESESRATVLRAVHKSGQCATPAMATGRRKAQDNDGRQHGQTDTIVRARDDPFVLKLKALGAVGRQFAGKTIVGGDGARVYALATPPCRR